MSNTDKAGVKRTYSRVQEGPWTSLNARAELHDHVEVKSKRPKLAYMSSVRPSVRPKARPNQLPSAPEGYAIAGSQFGVSGIPFGTFSSSYLQDPKTRSTSEPPFGLVAIPRRTSATPSSLVETIVPARQTMNRRASVPYLSTFSQFAPSAESPASQAPLLLLVRQASTSTTSTDLSSLPSLESGSAPTSPAALTDLSLSSENQFIANTQQLAEFAQRTSHSGRHGEWSTEKKEILCAYFLGNSFPNMRQREALGRQVGLETLQVSKFFSRTRSEVKYSRTTLRDLALQASFGLQFVGAESPRSPPSTSSSPLPKTSTVEAPQPTPTPAPTPKIGRPPGRGRGRGRGRGSRGGRGGLGSNRATRLEVDPPSASPPKMTPTLDPRSAARNTRDSSNTAPLVQEPYHTGPVTSSVQEAARSLMSISSARFPVDLPVLRGAHPRAGAPNAQHEQTSTGNLSPELMRNISYSRPSCKMKSGGSPIASRDEKPYLACLSRTASLFGPDARTLPPPPSHGHSGTSRLAHPPTCPSGVRVASLVTPVDSLALVADLFLSANGICAFP